MNQPESQMTTVHAETTPRAWTPTPAEVAQAALKAQFDALQARKALSAREEDEGVPHYEQTKHANDEAAPKGSQRVRVDHGDTTTPKAERVYVFVPAGFGEADRARRVRRKMRGLQILHVRTESEAPAEPVKEAV